MEKMNVPAVGRLTAADLMRLKVRTLVYLDELERSYWCEVSIFANDRAANNINLVRQTFSPEIEYAKELVKKLDEAIQDILTGELQVSSEAVAHLPRKANLS